MDHEASPKPIIRVKDKRNQRGAHMSKGRAPRDKRKLREKRRSTGVVHLQSTESTGGTSEEEEGDNDITETKRNTIINEMMEKLSNTPIDEKCGFIPRQFTQRRTKSPSDLEADDEDTQDCDSLHPSDSVHCLTQESLGIPFDEKVEDALSHDGRIDTPTGDNTLELLERAREENRKLLAALVEKDRQMAALKADRDALLDAVATLRAK
ncbi:hypothetical protein QYM36_005959 [Artemia franciscana]|nr:hypothetical protein QYM36_005959 [Artemia franciscana]